MNLERVQEIAKAVLYEGYMLYPYRPSAVKNRQRFNFGVLCPPSYCEANSGSESSFMQTVCLFTSTRSSRLTIRIGFLQIVQRSIVKYDSTGALEFVDRMEVDGHLYQPWQEAVERSVLYEDLDPAQLLASRRLEFSIPAEDSREELQSASCPVGAVLRASLPLAGSLHLHAEPCGNDVFKLRLRLENCTSRKAAAEKLDRERALAHSLVSAHMIMGIDDGEFLSLLDPPEDYADLARGCENTGNWPVLAGDDATTMLASPIILYDYPKIAPESAGNLFDSLEIDEILSLRILTLTDQEKEEIRRTDDRAREILDRTENIPDEQFMKLHGVLRGLTTLKEGSV